MVELAKRGFTPVTTPDLVQAAVLEKCGFQPRGTNTQVLPAVRPPMPTNICRGLKHSLQVCRLSALLCTTLVCASACHSVWADWRGCICA